MLFLCVIINFPIWRLKYRYIYNCELSTLFGHSTGLLIINIRSLPDSKSRKNELKKAISDGYYQSPCCSVHHNSLYILSKTSFANWAHFMLEKV